MKLIMVSCKKASELIEKKEDYKISPAESVRLFIHTSMCTICKGYEKQSILLKIALNNLFKDSEESQKDTEVPESLKKDIIKKIEAAA